MKLQFKRLRLLWIFAWLFGVVALAAYELYKLHALMTAGHQIGAAVAKGLDETVTRETATVPVSQCFGLLPLGPVGNPYLVIAVGDVILGTLITGFAILVVYRLRRGFRRDPPMGKSDGEFRNA